MSSGVLNGNQTSSNNNLVPTVPCSFSVNSIRKRKVKFTIQLDIEELLSVPYVNGVLFCKVRLCDGGNHVSYSSKKEVNNSKVLWSNNSPIQFDVKAVQLYSLTNTTDKQEQKTIIIGYEPCLCRISVRKELRGGKSYQKLGYVDYNLSDYILKYQQVIDQNSNEFCVNRILKEYDTNSKKNQQRLDNSYLKIKIRILDQCLNSQRSTSPKIVNPEANKEASSSPSESPSLNKNDSNLIKFNQEIPINFNIQSQSMTNTSSKNSVHTHTRNLSLTSNLGLSSTNSNTGYMVTNQNPYGHNRSCSNGSIKSNISFDFIIKNRNNKLMEDMQTTSSTSSFGNSGLIISGQSTSFSILNSNLKQEMASLSNSSSFLSNNGKNSFVNSSSSTSSIPIVNTNLNGTSSQSTLFNTNRLEPANLRIIETRVDPNEIIREIENELSNRLTNNKVIS